MKIVEVSGFEALPADLAVALAAETAKRALGRAALGRRPDAQRPAADGDAAARRHALGRHTPEPGRDRGQRGRPAMTDPAALITDPGRAARVRQRSPIAVSVRRADGAVIAPMAPAAFINPAVIQRTAALNAGEDPAAEPFRYREGMALDGHPATLPLRYAAAGALAGTQAGARRGDPHGPRCAKADRRRNAQGRCPPPASAPRATSSSSGGGRCRSGRSARRQPGPRRDRRRRPAGLLHDRDDARRGGAADGRPRRDARPRGMHHTGDRARHGLGRAASTARQMRFSVAE